ncbi:MAG: hypothetical protein GVY16_03540 [Planctomycetes bacterium]|nr:hypothetical protein [Phycisphaerae bacterium]NBB94792.1 hypothetical protein [Planctomycetota bacterium]
MQARSILVIAAVAAAVFVLGQLLLLPATAPATQNLTTMAAQQNVPLEVNGCTISAEVAAKVKPGDNPSVQFTVTNTTDQDVSFDLAVSEMSANQMPMSRAMVMPSESWKTTCPVAVKADATKVVTLVSESRARQWDNFHYVISTGDASIRTTQIGTNDLPVAEDNAAEESDA